MTPYEGNSPYIFISYAHKDSSVVLPILDEMEKAGLRVWYDAGIEAGTEWPEYIATHLEKAACVLAFLSPASVASSNCRQEINYAIDLQKPTLTVYLEEMTLTGGMRMRLGLTQSLFYYRHRTDASFMSELVKAQILAPCLDKSGAGSLVSAKPLINYDDFEITDGVLVKYKGKGGDVVIPDGVTKIGEYAFERCMSLVSVTIPDGVKSMDAAAFYRCENLEKVTVPNSMISVGSSAFFACDRLACNIYKEGKYVGNSTNPYMVLIGVIDQEITTLTLHDDTKIMGGFALEHCKRLTTVTIPSGVKTVGDGVFAYCEKLLYIAFPNSVETIESNAFYFCSSLERIVIPNSVTSIGKDLFSFCYNIPRIYCEAKSQPSGWDAKWNPDNRPVVWGYRE